MYIQGGPAENLDADISDLLRKIGKMLSKPIFPIIL